MVSKTTAALVLLLAVGVGMYNNSDGVRSARHKGIGKAADIHPVNATLNRPDPSKHYDIIILGGGLSGSTIGTVLAKEGVSVLIVDKADVPRMAVGESIQPFLYQLWFLLVELFDVPEFRHLMSIEAIMEHVGSQSGVKENFSFIWHEEGAAHARINDTFLAVLHNAAGEGRTPHVFRQDIDAYLNVLAVKYGAARTPNTKVLSIDLDDAAQVTVNTTRGVFHGDYLYDCSGFGSMLSRELGLRDKEANFQTHSRGMFTHMIGVTPFDELLPSPVAQSPWHHGSLSHSFDGGWMWIIPFNNHAKATNPLVSVGLMRDSQRFPKDASLTPQQDFDAFCAKYPSIGAAFANAYPVRDWVSTNRIQYSSKQHVGDRWALAYSAAGAVDGLYALGISSIMESSIVFLDTFLTEWRSGTSSYDAAAFAHLQRVQRGLHELHDNVSHAYYMSSKDPRIMRQVVEMWHMSSQYAFMSYIVASLNLETSHGDLSYAQAIIRNHTVYDSPCFHGFHLDHIKILESWTAGDITTDECDKQLNDLLETLECFPEIMRMHDHEKIVHTRTGPSTMAMFRGFYEINEPGMELVNQSFEWETLISGVIVQHIKQWILWQVHQVTRLFV